MFLRYFSMKPAISTKMKLIDLTGIMFSRYFSTKPGISTKPKPKMKPIDLTVPPEQTQTITRVIFDIVKEHGPLTVNDTWERVKEVGLRGLTGKRHMKIVLRWMRERQKLRLICNHVGPHKQFLYTTWFTKSNIRLPKPVNDSSQPKLPLDSKTTQL